MRLNCKLLVILILMTFSNVVFSDVSVFKHCQYKGYEIKLPAGDYTLSDLKALGVKNDDISSLKVSPGYAIKIYEHNNFKGKSHLFRNSDKCLVNNNFNDKVSSIRVGKMRFGSGYWQLQSTLSGKCIDVKSKSKNNRANIYMYQCHNGKNQGWKFISKGANVYQLKAQHSKKCLDVSSKSKKNKANIHQYSCLKIDNQKWVVTQKDTNKGVRYQLKAKHSGKCLTHLGNNNGSNLVQDKCSGKKNQLWRLKNINYTGG